MTEQHFRLESLAYQNDAVEVVVGVFRGTPKAQAQDGPGNRCSLSWPQLQDNMQQIAQRQRINPERLQLSAPAQGQPLDICVEMETGTGKTLVYLRTLYRLHTAYGWNKFIIVVPSVAIRAGVMGTLACNWPSSVGSTTRYPHLSTTAAASRGLKHLSTAPKPPSW